MKIKADRFCLAVAGLAFLLVHGPAVTRAETTDAQIAPSTFCLNTQGLHEIKAYLACQASPLIRSCAGLGTLRNNGFVPIVLPGFAGAALEKQRFVDRMSAKLNQEAGEDFWAQAETDYRTKMETSIDKLERRRVDLIHEENRLRPFFERANDIVVSDPHFTPDKADVDSRYVRRLHEIMDRNLPDKNQVFPPEYRAVLTELGEVERELEKSRRGLVDPNLAREESARVRRLRDELAQLRSKVENARKSGSWIEILSQQSTTQNRKNAEALYQIVQDRMAAGTLDEEFLDRAITQALPREFTGFNRAEPYKERMGRDWGRLGKMSRLQDVVQEFANEAVLRHTETLAAKFPSVAAGLRAAAKRGSVAVGAAAGPVGIAAAAVIEILFSPSQTACYAEGEKINEDVDRNCQAVYEANQTVLDFLSSSEEEQLKAFKERPKICEYYEKLHAKFFNRPTFEKLQCKGNDNGFILVTKDETGARIEHDVSLNEAKDIRRIALGRDGSYNGVLSFNPDGTLFSGHNSRGNREKLTRLKLYISDVKDCCLADESQRTRCLGMYNGRPIPGERPKSEPRKDASQDTGAIQ